VQLGSDGFLHLTYCTNIHPGDGWTAVDQNLRRFAPSLKERLAPAKPFGIGLRLSARDARELVDGRLEDFKAFLDREHLYVALINGFPYGPFHRAVVKADVYAPDWRDDARVQYTLDLIDILKRLLPAGLDGGVSTAPLSYKAWMREGTPADWETMTRNVVRVAEALVQTKQATGAVIHLDIEPEPDCVIENTDEAIEFFERWLLPVGGPRLAASLGCGEAAARQHLLDHIRLCFDCCHFAVEYEDPIAALDRLADAGIQIGRVQLSSALTVTLPVEPEQRAVLIERLHGFADATYLHQVIERKDGALRHYADLDEALRDAAMGGDRQWRIHFHVPLFTGNYGGLGSTQHYVRQVLWAARDRRFTRHLEIETYTWDVLPSTLKVDLLDSIGREYDWVLDALVPGPHGI
jgi:sugar phosphate isomerase/epimerase